MPIKIVYSGPGDALGALEQALGAPYAVVRVAAEAAEFARVLQDAEVLLDASMKVPVTAAMIAAAPALRLVITATTGADHIDARALEARGIPLLTLRGQTEFLRNITPAAELTWLLLMACARRLRGAVRHVENGGWDREQFPGLMLRGRTLGIVGCGRIGTWVARYARAFGMSVIGYDPWLTEFPETIARVALADVFAQADFVVLTLTFDDTTRHLVTGDELARMRAGTVLVNTSRGAIIREEDLIAGLERGTPAWLGTDVLEHEPDIGASLVWRYARDHDNVIITPHIGGFSPDALHEVLRYTAARVCAFFAPAA